MFPPCNEFEYPVQNVESTVGNQILRTISGENRMKFLRLFIPVALFWLPLVGQTSYFSKSDFALTSPGAFKTGLYGYDNPALLSYQHQPDLMLVWTDARGRWSDFNRWGLFTAVPNFGFALVHEKLGAANVTDYNVSFSAGDRSLSVGFGYQWSTGNRALFGRQALYTLGVVSRPNRYLSVGMAGTTGASSRANELIVDLAGRPLGDERVTLFADYAWREKNLPGLPTWSAGGIVEPLAGIRVAIRYFETKNLSLGIQISFGHASLSTQAHYDDRGTYSYATYGIRAGAYDRNFLRSTTQVRKSYVELDMKGTLGYQRFLLFDPTKTLSGLLNALEAAKSDPAVAGIAFNTSAMNAPSELLWELREKLKDFKNSGKKVIMFVDRLGISDYHFVSIADRIVMDPYGGLDIKGVLLGRMYLKGTLEKVGIAADELRFFKYKSAAESFSRENMSEADREQRQELANDFYELFKKDICVSRNITPEKFETLVNTKALLLPEEALAEGLVDTLGRWETVKELIKKLEGEEKSFMSIGRLEKPNLPHDNVWGEPPQIAVMYAIGACAMDEGITARKLVKDVEAAVENPRVKAIVLRVDSPGGDPMASDYVALPLKKARGKKPIIVSQGSVAASGGYWLSMYADTIVAAPHTVTGSIGVIGVWLYDNGLKKSLGFSTDFVKVGAHADLGFGVALPLIGGIPDRGLTQEERARVESSIKTLYTDFVGKVAEGRKTSKDRIEPIAQGRVWSGVDGLSNGLVDVLGGLETAIEIAKQRAGLTGIEVQLVEYPKKGLFDPSVFLPRLIGMETNRPDSRLMEIIKFHLRNNGKPMPILPLEDLLMMDTPFHSREH